MLADTITAAFLTLDIVQKPGKTETFFKAPCKVDDISNTNSIAACGGNTIDSLMLVPFD